MLRNYLKVAWRNILRNKGFTVTNLVSLTIGISCTIFIFLWIQDELTYDKFHKHHDNIYQVMANRDFNNQVFTDQNMVMPLASELRKGHPQIKDAVVTTQQQQRVLAYNETKLKKRSYFVSEGFFNVFTWKFLHGNPATAISDPTSIVLTESTATSIFGNENPLNKVIRIDDDRDVKVSAVVADPPGNSSIQFDAIMPFNYSDENVKRNMSEWTSSSWRVYIQAVPGANIASIEQTINRIKKQHDKNDAVSTYFTFPMSRWHLFSDFRDGKNIGGMIEYVRLFTIIAIVILLIACVNFMNLSTARSEKRSKEVGIRKTLGSSRKNLVMQFYMESLILSFGAFLFAFALVYLLLPSFNTLVGKQLALPIDQPLFWTAAAVIVGFTALVAGSYPALYLSSFNPVKVLKGTFAAGRSAVLPRRILVVAQFVISIFLISATIVIHQQIQHVKGRDLGYDPNNLIMIPTSAATQKNFTVIKDELLKTGNIKAVTRTLSPMTAIWWSSPAPDWDGKPADAEIIVTGNTVDVDFTKTMGVKMLEGKDFAGVPADTSGMILNKAAVEAMALKNPLGMQMRYGSKTYTVIGITDNIVMSSPYEPVDPMMMYFGPENTNYITIRLNDGVRPQQAIAQLESVFKRHNPAYPFEYEFVDESFNNKFLTEVLISKITNIFAMLAIFICCIGLAGLASFTIEKRIREIGIRKVLGASLQQLLLLISKEFLKLVFVAFVIAVPLTWWLMFNWLEKYPYRVDIGVWLFMIVGVVILLLTLAVVSINTLRAATTSPVKNLRTE
jgi:putative ABC transport system permease protein